MEHAFKELHWKREISVRHYLQPSSLEEALKRLAEFDGKAWIVAGGTDVVLQLRTEDLEVDALIDITAIPGLAAIELRGNDLCLGGLVTHSRLCTSPLIRERASLLAEAAEKVGSPQIRNVATVAGNLVSGQPAADLALPLLALGGRVTILSASGEREVPLTQFFFSPGKTALDPSREILTKITFPALNEDQGGAYTRLSKRKALSLPVLAVAAVVTVSPDRKTLCEASLGLGPVAPVPFRPSKAEALLKGAPISRETLEQAAAAAQEEARPRTSLIRGSSEYRREMVRVLVRRSLTRALEAAGAPVKE
jgi:CO/xanthine dehydrogenase FAD-binding subunit